MEDSEQRKKRLKEMRMQADLAETSGGGEGSRLVLPGALSNPLIEASSQETSYTAPRFDFYTDPMAAFSSNKRSNANIQATPDYFPSPNFGGSPMAQFSSPHPGSMNPQMTPSPTQVMPAPYRNPVWIGPRGPAHHNYPLRPPSSGTYQNPGFEPSGSPFYNSVQGISHRPNHSPMPSTGYRNSPSPSPGRGRGFGFNTRSPVSGQDIGCGQSSPGRGSSENRAFRPDQFYKRSMVEDPWKILKPVTWKATDASLNTLYTPGNSKSWSSKSTIRKGGGESSAALVKPSSEPSLAEYLAAAFNEVANDEENV